jgi:hypothetical protein
LLPLQKALEPISSKLDQLDRFSKIAKNECHFPSEHGLTRDESAAIFLYTMEWGENSFYQVLNRALRAEDRSSLKPWFAYLKLFDTAANKLPTVRQNLWRGVARDITKNFKKGDEFTWWSISSCSTSVNIIKDFLGSNSTLFLIEAVNGKDVSNYTNYPSENEVILCPGTRLRVVSDPLDQPPMHLIHLQEVTDDNDEHVLTSLQAMTIAHSPKTESIHATVNVQSSPVQIYTDIGGNKYEGQMKDGKKHGKGKMDFAIGDKYTGDWVENNRTGQGILIFASGNRYEGQFKDNNMHGKGKMDFATGDKYTGDWVENNRTGQGILIFASGNRYEGQWKDNNMHGKGKNVWGSETQWAGDTYNGDWVEGNRTGQGVYNFASGNRYEGQWKDNKKHGKGKMKYANGTVQDGMWSNDEFVG